jgi:hypothetical protein
LLCNLTLQLCFNNARRNGHLFHHKMLSSFQILHRAARRHLHVYCVVLRSPFDLLLINNAFRRNDGFKTRNPGPTEWLLLVQCLQASGAVRGRANPSGLQE